MEIEKKTARITLTVLLILAVVGVCWLCRALIADVLIALTLAAAMTPIVEKAQKRKIPRALTVLLTYFLVASFYVGLGFAVAVPLKAQVRTFVANVPAYEDKVMHLYQHAQDFVGDNINMQVKPEEMKGLAIKVGSRMFDLGTGILGVSVHVVFILFLAAYFASCADSLWKSLIKLVPADRRDEVGSLIEPIANRMGGYVRGQLMVATAVAVFFSIGFSLIGLNYALVIGCLAGVLNLVPYVGSVVATVAALLIASNQSVTTVLLTLAVFAIEQTVESNFFVPHLLGQQVDMHPLVVLFAVLIGASIGGIVGVLVIVPVTAAILYVAQKYLWTEVEELQAAE